MTGLVILQAIADQGGPLAYAKEMLIPKPTLLACCTAVNKGASACYIQFIDSPRKLAVPITDSAVVAATYTAPGHQFVTGDAVTLTGITGGPFAGYLHVIDADTFSFHESRADALAGSDAVAPANEGETGTLDLTSNLAAPPVPEEYPLAAAASAPANVMSLLNARFHRGLYVRAVTAINGSTLISAADVKFTPRHRQGDLLPEHAYED